MWDFTRNPDINSLKFYRANWNGDYHIYRVQSKLDVGFFTSDADSIINRKERPTHNAPQRKLTHKRA